ncbi:MAG TPA: ABC transporter substrate-binding protein [Acidimicrobiia bacterium]|nr:ABC transporter substrate-binding protein [Acidimicrobiia bacterium]
MEHRAPTASAPRRSRVFRILAILSVLAMVLAACGGDEASDTTTTTAATGGDTTTTAAGGDGDGDGSMLPAPELTTIRFGISALEFHSFPLHYAGVTGILEKYGITELEETYTEGVSSAIQALAGDRLDVQAGTGSSVISSLTTDTPFLTIGTTLSKLTDGLFGGEGIASMEDLRGQAIAISTFGGESHAVVVSSLLGAGMTPSDVEIVQIGGQSDRIAAVLGGSVAAAPIDIARREQMEEEGMTLLVNLAETDQQLPRGGLNVTREWAETNPNTALILVAATMEAIQLMKEDPEAAAQEHMVWASGEDIEDSRNELALYLQFVNEDLVIGIDPWLTMQETLAATAPAVADVDVSEAYTNRFVEQLDELGFLAQWGLTIEE